MDPPDRQLDPLRLERLPPGEDVLIDAVEEGAVEVEEHRRPSGVSGGEALHCLQTYSAMARLQRRRRLLFP